MVCELAVDFSFTDAERAALTARFEAINVHPYRTYPAFRHHVRLLAAEEPHAARLRQFLHVHRSRSSFDRPFVFMRNTPVDRHLPDLDNSNPVSAKHALKSSFVAEAFLQLYAELAGEHPISYVNVNGGDVYQDIFPQESMKASQSQKALGPIHFHKDLANHFVRPDTVNILSLRSSDANEIHTVFASNREVLAALDGETLDVLRKPWFHTPYDDLTLRGARVALGRAPAHAVLACESDLRFFEHRTEALDSRGTDALEKLAAAVHACKRRVLMRPGDFVSIANNLSLHGKEVGRIGDPREQRRRWSIKTVNVHVVAPHLRHMVAGTDYLING